MSKAKLGYLESHKVICPNTAIRKVASERLAVVVKLAFVSIMMPKKVSEKVSKASPGLFGQVSVKSHCSDQLEGS